MAILMDGGNALEWGDSRTTHAVFPVGRLPDMDGFQIEDSMEVDPGRPCGGLAALRAWIDTAD